MEDKTKQAIMDMVLTAKNAGATEDQVISFLSRQYVPLPWQWKFHAMSRACDLPDGPTELGAGGARGPGKSHCVFAQVTLDDCQRINNLKVLFLRQTGKAAKESFEDLIDKVLAGKTSYQYNPSTSRLTFPNGAKVLLGGFETASDIDKYIGIEYDLIAVEELNQLSQDKIDKLLGSMRSSKPNWRPRLYTSFNPGGKGHEFVKSKFVKPFQQGTETKTRFIKSGYKDNPYLNKEYVDYLEDLTGMLGKAWRDGDFNIFAGQYFSEWNQDTHVVEAFEIPDTWKKIRCIDHGRTAPTACLWGAIDYDGKIWWYREYHMTDVDADINAQAIAKLSIGEKYVFTVLDSACFSKTGSGETIAEIYLRNGVYAEPAKKNRLAGWALFHEYLRGDKDTLGEFKPRMVFFRGCINAIETIPTLIHDERHMEDLDGMNIDHCLIGETYIETDEGKKQIKGLVGKTGYVKTLYGLQRFDRVSLTQRDAELMRLVVGEMELIATPEHRVLTNNGWKQLNQVKLTDKIVCIKSSQPQSKSLMVGNFIYVVSIFKAMGYGFIEKFGNILTEIFQKISTFITKTITEVITTFQTLRYYINPSTQRTTYQRQNALSNQERVLKSLENLLISGTAHQQGWSFTRNLGSLLGSIIRFIQKVALYVLKSFSHLWKEPFVAEEIVTLDYIGKGNVYNLRVRSVRHFAVNGGLIVHNCADAISYGLQMLHESKSPKPLNDLERKFSEWKKADQVNPTNLNKFYSGH